MDNKVLKTYRITMKGEYTSYREETYEVEAKNEQDARDEADYMFSDDCDAYDYDEADISVSECVLLGERTAEIPPPRCTKTIDMFGDTK